MDVVERIRVEDVEVGAFASLDDTGATLNPTRSQRGCTTCGCSTDSRCERLGVRGFPSLVAVASRRLTLLCHSYRSKSKMSFDLSPHSDLGTNKKIDIRFYISYYSTRMFYSSKQAAQKLGIPYTTLSTYLTRGKIAAPQSISTGDINMYVWTEEDIERARKLLPKIANGRKTRYQKKQSTGSTQQSVKTRKKKKIEK